MIIKLKVPAAMKTKQCSHNVFLQGKCTACNILKQDIATIPVNYLNPGVDMSLTLSAMERFRDQDLQNVLGQKKLNLILDLDNTLLHARKTNKLTLKDKEHVISDSNDVYKVENGSKLVKLRPGAREFLKKAREMFELSIYTMGTRDYAHTMADLLAVGLDNEDGRSMFGKRIISREDCTMTRTKGLDVVLSDPRVVLIVDDKIEVWEDSCRANVVNIAPYRFFEDVKLKRESSSKDEATTTTMDDELKSILKKLSLVHQMFYEDYYYYKDNDEAVRKSDVRRVLEKVGDLEEQKKKEDEESATTRKRKARLVIKKFCAPLEKRHKDNNQTSRTNPSDLIC